MHRLRGKLVVAMLIFHAVLLAWGASRHSFAWTEVGLLPSGLVHWKYGSFDTFRVNPPLWRMWATLPVLAMQPNVPEVTISGDPRQRAEWTIGQDFVDANGTYAFACLAIARWMCIPFSLLADGFVIAGLMSCTERMPDWRCWRCGVSRRTCSPTDR
jgi:hypothetical protein